jgi:hypothetical protein
VWHRGFRSNCGLLRCHVTFAEGFECTGSACAGQQPASQPPLPHWASGGVCGARVCLKCCALTVHSCQRYALTWTWKWVGRGEGGLSRPPLAVLASPRFLAEAVAAAMARGCMAQPSAMLCAPAAIAALSACTSSRPAPLQGLVSNGACYVCCTIRPPAVAVGLIVLVSCWAAGPDAALAGHCCTWVCAIV